MRRTKEMKKGLKRGLAIALSAAMVVGIAPMAPGNVSRVQAEESTESGLKATVYATKDQLMNFSPDSSAKLVFGKNDQGNAQEWYVLGKDNGVEVDNAVIFATESMTTGMFDSNNNGNTYKEGNQEYPVHPNHYGASVLRQTLQGMVSVDNNTYFSVAEKSLMQETTIITKDVLNQKDYTTSDKLYALASEDQDYYQKMYVGSNNDKELDVTFCGNNTDFWLRTPSDSLVNHALCACPGLYRIGGILVQYSRGVRPASNLNLSSVLFASAARASGGAAYGEIADGTAMTLRLDGSDKNIGTVNYIIGSREIIAVKGSTTNDVVLMVQGNDGTKDWYYRSAPLESSACTYNATDIMTQLDMSSSDFSKCKIWLETTEDNVTYAVNAAKKEIVSIISANIKAPIEGEELSKQISCYAEGVAEAKITWDKEIAGYYPDTCKAQITFTPADGYIFTENTVLNINTEERNDGKVLNPDGTLTITVKFEFKKDKLISIDFPEPITVANGTAYEDMNLPTQVAIETKGSTINKADVTWDTKSPVSGSYDPAVITKQTVTLKGNVSGLDNLDMKEVDPVTYITITIWAMETVEAPTASVASGTYTKNQSVILSSATEGATIYYTTDGTEPDKTNGEIYTVPIAVTGTAGESVATTIKAIAVKDRMQDSEVQTFTYTIELPEPTPTPVPTPTPTPGQSGNSDNSGSGSSTDSSADVKIVDWEQVAADMRQPLTGEGNLNYTVRGENRVATSVLQQLAGLRQTLAFHSGNGIALSISGQDVDRNALNNLNSMNLTVADGTLSDKICSTKETGSLKNLQLSVYDSGAFAVLVNLHVNVGAEYAGNYANLYRYNAQTGSLDYCGSYRVNADGRAMFGLKLGGEYLVTVTWAIPQETAVHTDGEYIVKAGDALSRIAVRYHMPLADLIRKNPQIKNISKIYPGQRIRLN
ncbi:chitobiase/beta-hexosaminidase C-terminal domain-containing protein [Simiaoa sp.]|uniref:chitobiase/beta-hexosaminidase C-terminal domain-containing protein n=1 Tax=Simiaoa sp. TaxID=2944202 RepID=UPI003F7D7CCD